MRTEKGPFFADRRYTWGLGKAGFSHRVRTETGGSTNAGNSQPSGPPRVSDSWCCKGVARLRTVTPELKRAIPRDF